MAAAEGRVVSGQIVPPLAGVVVRMTLEGAAPLEATSDAKGVPCDRPRDAFHILYGNEKVA